MATIDALGGVASFQAQPVTKVQVAEPTRIEITDGQIQATPQVDEVTKAVEKSGEAFEENAQDSKQFKEPTNEQIRKAVDDINKKASTSEVQFGIHEATNRITIKIVDKQTKKVIKELPPEKTLDMIAKAWEMAGILVDEKR
ncbi:MAG: flagellar protein FlaG [Lachnospiraceae bacterium]|nr:flagellar protein FlaG [Lachnospiraceae bacterium]